MRLRVVLTAALGLTLPDFAFADRFDDWDKNKDGKLQKEELPPNARGNFDRADTNQDGVLSREEDQAFLRRRPGTRSGQGRVPDSLRVVKDLDYVGDGNPRQALDLYVPKAKSQTPRPLIVFIHGGGWRQGSKDGGLRRLGPLLESGMYVGASLNYRLTGEASWPAQIHDCKAAIRWLKAHAGEYGFDAGKIGVWGTSAGGHLVAMLGVAGDVPSLEGKLGVHLDQDSTVDCVVNFFGPSNLLTMVDFPSTMNHAAADSPEGKLVGGALAERKDVARNASPVTHVSKQDASFLIAHGSEDPLVPHAQSIELSKALEAREVPVVFVTMSEAGHGFQSEELNRRVTAFFARELLGEKKELSAVAIPKGK